MNYNDTVEDDAFKLMDLASVRLNWMMVVTKLSRTPTGFNLGGGLTLTYPPKTDPQVMLK